MYRFGAQFTHLLLAAGPLVLFVALGLWFFWKKQSIALALWLVIMLFSTPLSLRLVSLPLTLLTPNVVLDTSYDAAVVLGGSLNEVRSGQYYFNLAVGRFIEGVRLYKQKRVQNLAFIGQAPNLFEKTFLEAEALKSLAIEFGLPENSIFVDNTSQNTQENAQVAMAIIKAQGWQKILVVTSWPHAFRASVAFQRVGLPCVFQADRTTYFGRTLPGMKQSLICQMYPTNPPRGWSYYEFLPHPASWSELSSILHEYLGLLALLVPLGANT